MFVTTASLNKLLRPLSDVTREGVDLTVSLGGKGHKQLLLEVWGPNAAGDKHYLRVYMTHLRRKLARAPGDPGVFETEAGVGYRLKWDGA